MSQAALIVIDLQKDYFPGGFLPLHRAEETLAAVERAIDQTKTKGMPVILVQHVAPAEAPFFKVGSDGVNIHPRILAAAPDAPIIVKQFADSFEQTRLHETLQNLKVDTLILCGMMTQNCVTHTALSRRADNYTKTIVLSDATTTVSELLHQIALNALSTRVTLATLNTWQ